MYSLEDVIGWFGTVAVIPRMGGYMLVQWAPLRNKRQNKVMFIGA